MKNLKKELNSYYKKLKTFIPNIYFPSDKSSQYIYTYEPHTDFK